MHHSLNIGMPRSFAITVAYDGTNYAGWQLQPNGITIQQRLMEAIEATTSERVNVQGSGRTDSGVHAIGQVASFTLKGWRHEAHRLVPAINRFLPRDICVRDCRPAVLGFDPIRTAIGKRYRYTIRNSRIPDPLNYQKHWWFTRELSADAMQQAANILIGTHDFKAFESNGSTRKTSTRTVRELSVTEVPAVDGKEIHIEIEADGFLYNMVRNIAGALVEVGTERFVPMWIRTILDGRVRDSSSSTAPPYGLCLMHVTYPEHVFLKRSDTGESEQTDAQENP